MLNAVFLNMRGKLMLVIGCKLISNVQLELEMKKAF